jgi:hypothetical protein
MADLESVIVGGAIAIAGGLATQLLLEYLKQRAEKKKRKAEKLEELLTLLSEHVDTYLREGVAYGDTEKEIVQLNAKIHTILLIYFRQYAASFSDIARMRVSNQEEWEDYGKKANVFTKELHKYAEREFQ